MPSKHLELDFTHCLAGNVGRTNGISKALLSERAISLARSCDLWDEDINPHHFAFAQLPYQSYDALENILELAHKTRKFRHLVVCGMGGSALGLRALRGALPEAFRKKVTVVDNVDPNTVACLAKKLNFATTLFNFISKSASTPETIAHFLYFRREMEKRHKKLLTDNIVLTLGTSPSDLERACPGAHRLDIPFDVGGRFSVLTPVGLFPAAWSGVPVVKIMEGARKLAAYLRKTPPEKNPLYLSVALLGLLREKGKTVQVIMPYADRLADFAHWYAQLWGESLGKKKTRRGKTVFAGQTPIVARGASDQHSQLQLWMEGPRDKVVAFFHLKDFDSEGRLSSKGKHADSMAYLSGKSLRELLHAQETATSVSLAKAGCPNLTYDIPSLTPERLGALFYFFECQTALMGEFFDVNAFNQPGVEAGKRATFALMGRKGFKSQSFDLASQLKKRDKV